MVAGEPRRRSYLFDTNIVIASFEKDRAVTQRLEGLQAERLFVPVIVLGELRFGALGSSRAQQNLVRLEEFASASNVLPCDETTARLYGEVKDALRRKGRPIPENDVWIAALTRQHDLTLVSRDSHFEHLEGLDLEQW